ncbi:hypothetical protein [Phyllobacterium phragmitis]|uniref:Uncharacterized protein n=1 Tax=Phyllobacterium phragmitis TaxID=2670329 RepID=A0ABQ0GYJ3_9HYPH
MDFSQIESVLGLATTALSATGKAVSTVEAIKKLVSSEKPSDTGEANKLLNALATELTAANLMNVQLSDALRALSQELRRQDEFEREKARYELFKTEQNDLVFKLREDLANGQPVHFICPVCLNSERQISFISGEGDFKICQRINTHAFRFSSSQYHSARRARTDWDPFV